MVSLAAGQMLAAQGTIDRWLAHAVSPRGPDRPRAARSLLEDCDGP